MPLEHDNLLRLLLAQRAMIVGYIVSIVRDAHLAEDIFQDVALIVLKKGGTLEDPAAFPAWARKIARFEALNMLRRQNRGPQHLDNSVLNLLEDHWDAADATSPSTATEAVRECIQKLPPRSRQLVELRYRDNISGKSLADRLTQSLNTVYVALSRVHRALSSCVKLRLSRGDAAHA